MAITDSVIHALIHSVDFSGAATLGWLFFGSRDCAAAWHSDIMQKSEALFGLSCGEFGK